MKKYVSAVECADIISEKMNIPLADLVDVFADVPSADVVEVTQAGGQYGRSRKTD